MKYIRITDTFGIHDTLTVEQSLVQSPDKFFKLAESIVGSNFLKKPHESEWKEDDCQMQSIAPMWINMHEPNSLVWWTIYFIERALWINFQNNVHNQYSSALDVNKKPIFITPENKTISLKEESKVFWRQLKDSQINITEQVKEKSFVLFSVTYDNSKADQSKVDHFTGGLKIQAKEQNNDQDN